MKQSRRPAAPIVLLTGFEPFGGDASNPSWEIASRLDGWRVDTRPPASPDVAGSLAPDAIAPSAPAHPAPDGGGAAIATVRSVLLPCVFHRALEVLDAAIACHRPSVVIALGLAASRRDISIERIAINIDDARIPDNAGRQPIDQPVLAGAPCAYWSTLPIKAIVAALREAGIAASVSQSAGTFVCNHVFFGLAHHLAEGRFQAAPAAGAGVQARETAAGSAPARGGFIHVPWPAQVPGAGQATDGAAGGLADAGAMNLQTMVAAIRIAVWTTLTAGASDLQLPGGALD